MSAAPFCRAAEDSEGGDVKSSVDVVVPCYRYGHFLRQCVESVLSQASVDVRVLIIDDASPDNTAEVASALASMDPRVYFVRHGRDGAGCDRRILSSPDTRDDTADSPLSPDSKGACAVRSRRARRPDERIAAMPPRSPKIIPTADLWKRHQLPLN